MTVFDLIGKNKAIPPFQSGTGLFCVEDINGISYLVASAYKKRKQKYLLICSNYYKAQKLYSLLSSLIGVEKVFLYPGDEFIRSESIEEGKEMVSQRLYTLSKIIENKADIVIANVAASSKYIASPEVFKSHSLSFKVGEKINLKELRNNLVQGGYTFVNKVDQSLQFAIRGEIIDICSVNLENPVRIELFDDEIESIRYFDMATQTSIEKTDEINILPSSEYLLSEEEIKSGIAKIYDKLEKEKDRFPYDLKENLTNLVESDITDLLERNINTRVSRYFKFLSRNPASIFDYCQNFTKVFVNKNSIKEEIDILFNETNAYMISLQESGSSLSGLGELYDFSFLINSRSSIITTESSADEKCFEFNLKNIPYISSKEGDAINIIQSYLGEDYKILLSLSTSEQLLTLTETLSGLNIPFEKVKAFTIPENSNIGIDICSLEKGFYIPEEKICILTSKELFNLNVRSARYTPRFKEATILKSFEDLNPGDYVVHEFQGIGQFVSLETLEIEGKHQDYLKIRYAGTDVLYVPVTQFQLVRKYLGKEGYAPKLSRLHSKDWENTKKKLKERINDLAERLMHLYTERSKIKGFAFSKDDEIQNQFESGFEHELTSDQERSLKEIKEEMEKPYPMDRLLCGDVGFGKTEIAFRAAFKAISSGKQVAILCPTTILARQHFERALERFSPFGVRIAMFSRFVSAKKQKQYIAGVKDGSIHLIIGTHRLLSKDISFKELGLLIVDEEQRFGVEQKEKFKELKNNIDVLTLSATPIPRTLQISMIGVRSLSMINSAPKERMPVQTYVLPQKDDLVKELIERELGRNGQVFYLHNKVHDLYDVASRIQKLVPEAVIGVAHGQMNREDIEDIMLKFYSNEINVLICTSIVENGIDIPNANMMIIENADEYGLSQLYQIKGRVGRSDRIAYCYLMYNGNKVVNEKAQKRLDAIKEFTALGSGYRIAQRDLMIRGAGDILGAEQAGFIDSIGLDMYVKLLNESIKEKMGEVLEREEPSESINLNIDAYIPSSYAKDSDKIEIYHDIEDTKTIENLAKLKLKVLDIFGSMPESVDLLFKKQAIDIYSKNSDIDKLYIAKDYVEITLGEKYSLIKGIGNKLFEVLYPYMKVLKISYLNRQFKIRLNKRKIWVDDLESILKLLSSLIKDK